MKTIMARSRHEDIHNSWTLLDFGGSMKRGDIVKYSRPVNEEEAAFRFVLLNEPEKGRVDIQLICDERLRPIETVEVGEVELAED
jgi:hypothetical protein